MHLCNLCGHFEYNKPIFKNKKNNFLILKLTGKLRYFPIFRSFPKKVLGGWEIDPKNTTD